MSANIQNLSARKRDEKGTSHSKKLRRTGRIPGVIYGGHQDNYGVDLKATEMGDLLKKSSTENVLVRLDIEGAREQNKLALIQDVQHHPLNGSIVHVDFRAVRDDDPIVASVPLQLLGDCPGLKQGGLLQQQLHALEVRCLPNALPEVVEGDIGELNLGQAFHVKELKWPDGVEPVLDGEVVVAICQEMASAKSAGGGDDDAAEAAATPESEEGGEAEAS